MRTRFPQIITSLAGVGALLTSSCVQLEEKAIINADNTGKSQVTIEMPDPSAMLGGLGAPDGGAAAPAADPNETAKEFAQGVLGGAMGVEAWSNVEYGVTPEGKMRFRGVAYFPDFTDYEVSPGGGGGMEMEGPGGGGLKSEMRDGKWVISMDMEPDAEADPDEPAGEPVPADEIDGKLQQARAQWQAMKGMMAGFFTGLKFEYKLKVAGEIESVSNFVKHDTNVAGVVMDGEKILGVMDAMLMDDDLMKASLAAGEVDEQGMPKNPPADLAAKMMFGEEGPVEIVIIPGDPLFDYAAEVEAAKAAMTDDIKAMIEAGKAAAAAEGDDDPF